MTKHTQCWIAQCLVVAVLQDRFSGEQKVVGGKYGEGRKKRRKGRRERKKGGKRKKGKKDKKEEKKGGREGGRKKRTKYIWEFRT